MRVVIQQTPREANVVVHTLAGMMRAFPYGPIMFQETLVGVVGQLRLDVRLMHDGTRIIL